MVKNGRSPVAAGAIQIEDRHESQPSGIFIVGMIIRKAVFLFGGEDFLVGRFVDGDSTVLRLNVLGKDHPQVVAGVIADATGGGGAGGGNAVELSPRPV